MLGQHEEYKSAWMDVEFVFGPINMKQHWLIATIDLNEKSLDYDIFCSKFVEFLVTGGNRDNLKQKYISFCRRQHVAKLLSNKYLF